MLKFKKNSPETSQPASLVSFPFHVTDEAYNLNESEVTQKKDDPKT